MNLTNPFQDKDFAKFQHLAKKANKIHLINGHIVYQYSLFGKHNLLYTDLNQTELKDLAKKENAIYTQIESYSNSKSVNSDSPLKTHKAFKTIIPQHTLAIDLNQSEEELLKNMHPKGRYNIKLASRKNVQVEESTDCLAFFRILEKTGMRDDFNINPYPHYQAMLDTLTDMNKVKLYLAYINDQAIAGVIVTFIGNTATYFYGASDYQYRKLMAPYALQWTAINEAKKIGLKYYDFLGIADPGNPHDPLHGVTIFKQKFGGKLIKHPDSQVIIHQPVLFYALQIKNFLKKLKRKLKS